MEGHRLLSGEDVAPDDLLHLVADHMKDDWREYNFTDGPVKLPYTWFWKSSRTKFQVLKKWLKRKRATSVQGLIQTIRHWEKNGYINGELWQQLQDKVDVDSIQSGGKANEIRLLTGQNEVTNTLVDLVVLHINKALHPYFAIEQLSLTWEELSAIDLYGCEFEDEYYQQILRIWYWEHCSGCMTTESFLRRLKKWEHAGFIHSDVWSHMNDILDSDARTSIEVGASISTPDEFEKLTEDDMITNRVVSCVSRFIVTSRMLQFALEILRLEFNQLMEAEYDFQQDKMRSNIEIMMLWFESFTEKMTVKMFLQKLKQWEHCGFITSDVWSHIGNYVDSDAVASTSSASTRDDHDDDESPSVDRLLSCVARYVADSRTLQFTIDLLGLSSFRYRAIERGNPDNSHLVKFKILQEWRDNHEGIPVKKLLGMLPDWVEKGYVDGDVWKDLSKFVNQETIASVLNKSGSPVDVSIFRANQADRLFSHLSQYVYPSELKEFAVKRLGIRETRYEMIEEDHIYAKRRNFEVLHLWSRSQKSLSSKFLMSKVLLWQRAGYVSKDVWNEMDKIVNPELLPSQEEINENSDIVFASASCEQEVETGHVTDERQKLSESDIIPDGLFHHISQSIYPSKRKRFALDTLGLEDSEYCDVNAETIWAWERNYKVIEVWYKKAAPMTVRDWIENIASWVKVGFVSPDVWLDLQEEVRLDVLCGYMETTFVEQKPENAAGFGHLLKRTKRSIRIRCWSPLSTEWMLEDKAKTFPLHNYPVQFELISSKSNAPSENQISFERIEEIFDLQETKQPSKVLLKGVAAMGKTYTLAAFANEWAQHETVDKSDTPHMVKIKSFDLIFLVRLRNVTSNIPLETIIAEQHELFKEQKNQLKSILDGTIKYKVLLCLDGYDEYTPGTNEAIDQAIRAPNENYSILVTSRPGQYVSRSVMEQMNFQLQLDGFRDDEIKKCTEDYLGKAEETQKFIKNLKDSGLKDLSKIPAFLLMLLQLHGKLESLPKKKTEVIWNIMKMCIDRSVQRHFHKTVNEMENLDEMLYRLGELSWNALKKYVSNLVVSKTDIEKINADILKLGLLQGVLYDETSTDLKDLPERLSFPIKLFQEFLSGYYVSKEKQKSWWDIFPSWDNITRYGQVVLSVCGLAFDPLPLLQHIHRMFIDWKERVMATQADVDIEAEEELFTSLARESGVCLVPPLEQLSLTRAQCTTDFGVALIKGDAVTLQDPHSDVYVDIPAGIKGTVWQKIHTEFSRFLHIVPDEECFIGPVVELHLKPFPGEESGQHQYRIKIPHCLQTEEERSSVKVRSGDLGKKIPFREMPNKQEASEKLPYYEDLRKISEEAHPPLRRLRPLDIPIEGDSRELVTDSEVAVRFRVDDGRNWQGDNPYDKCWNGTEKVCPKRSIDSCMDVKCKHLCKVDRYPRTAGIFELRISEPLQTFEGSFQVTMYATTSPPGKETKIAEAWRSLRIINEIPGSFDQTIISNVQSPIGDHELSAIAREMGSQSMETFALRYLGLDGDQIQTINDSRRDNRDRFKFDILEHWRNRNPGPNARAILDNLLQLGARNDGLLTYSKVNRAWEEALRSFSK